jgi:hypothetical protein
MPAIMGWSSPAKQQGAQNAIHDYAAYADHFRTVEFSLPFRKEICEANRQLLVFLASFFKV